MRNLRLLIITIPKVRNCPLVESAVLTKLLQVYLTGLSSQSRVSTLLRPATHSQRFRRANSHLREMIILPYINEIADKVNDQIISAPNGDCRPIAYPGDRYFLDPYNVTFTGMSGAIACGLTAAIKASGIAVPIEGDTNGLQPQLSGGPDQSTNHDVGAFVPPPPKSPFKPLARTSYACLFHGNERTQKIKIQRRRHQNLQHSRTIWTPLPEISTMKPHSPSQLPPTDLIPRAASSASHPLAVKYGAWA